MRLVRKGRESIETFYKKSSLDNSRKDARGQGRADESSGEKEGECRGILQEDW